MNVKVDVLQRRELLLKHAFIKIQYSLGGGGEVKQLLGY